MNYLAHLRLSPDEPLLRLGNLLGDFAVGVDVAALPEPVRRGLAQHRAIDRFTDAHPVFRRSRARLAPPFSRFSGVLVDVFYDHFLAVHWPRLGDGRPLRDFAVQVYGELLQHEALLPGRLRTALPHMREQDWLGSYAQLAGVDAVLGRMARRLRRENPLGLGGGELRRCHPELEADFEQFWREVSCFARAAD